MSKDTEDLRDRFFNELTRKREDGVMEFNCLPHNVFEWIGGNAQQSSITDDLLQELYDNCDQDMITKSDFYLSGFSDGKGYGEIPNLTTEKIKELLKKYSKEYADRGVHVYYINPAHLANFINWLRDLQSKTQPVTDKQIEKQFPLKHPSSIRNLKDAEEDYKNEQKRIGAKWLRDLQPKTDDWVSVDDRLPEPEVSILIYLNHYKGGRVQKSHYSEHHKCFDHFLQEDITHWKPLPQPPNNKNR